MEPKLTREQLIELVDRICKTEGTAEEIDRWVGILRANLIDPAVTDYIFWPEEKMTPEQIVDRALAYKPILL